MYPSLRVANYILDLAFNEGVKVDHMKLQKLVYISHGWFLGFHHDPLTSDQPQAWRYGPVYRMLYDRCKAFGNKSIDTYIDIQNDGVIAPNEYKLDERANALVKKVWDGYKKYSALQLSSLTHKEGTPWHKTRTELGSGEVIPTKYISDYYQQKITHGGGSGLRQAVVGGSAVLSSSDRSMANEYCVVQGCGERGQCYITAPWGEQIGPYCVECALVRDGQH